MSTDVSRACEHPDCILYAQHGWADDYRRIAALAELIAPPNTKVVTPNLGYLNTWFWIEPLIQRVDDLATANWHRFSDVPMRVVGHSMGGLIWLEVLHRHPEWWSQVDSIVLVASPVGGSDLGRIFDPFDWGIGVARDLGKNRRGMAEAIAAQIPTLVIAGNTDGGSDGTVILGATQFRYAHFVELPGVSHPALRNHPRVAAAILEFWSSQKAPQLPQSGLTATLIQRLQAVPGMTDAHPRDALKATPCLQFDHGLTLRTWRNGFGVHHVFLVSGEGQCIYSGFVGWRQTTHLHQTLASIQRDYA